MSRFLVQIIGPDERLHSAETVDCSLLSRRNMVLCCSAGEAARERRGNAHSASMTQNGGLVLRTTGVAALLAEENGKKPKRQAERHSSKARATR